jgi:ribosomal protein S18 acetylase RimI-like enzyme
MSDNEHNIFETFDDHPSPPKESVHIDSVVIRHASEQDAIQLGDISARREGLNPEDQAEAFKRMVNHPSAGGTSLVLVAETEGRVAGFAKLRYLRKGEEHGAGSGPDGWYLTGIVVDPPYRRQGIGSKLTEARLEWISKRGRSVYYFTNARPQVRIALHRQFGFVEIARGPEFGCVTFEGGEGILWKADLSGFASEKR